MEQVAERTDPPTSFAMIAFLEKSKRELRREWIIKLARALNCHESDIKISDTEDFTENKNTVSLMESDPIRDQLKLAIRLWFTSNEHSAIQTLAIEVYKTLYPIEKHKNLNKSAPEGMMLHSIIKIQALGNALNNTEYAFMLWMFLERPALFRQEFWEAFQQRLPVDGYKKDGKPVKADFFKIISGNSIDG